MAKKFTKEKILALIPARKGSERIINKNIVKLSNHPLIAYTINVAKKSKIFDKIVVSTDSTIYSKISQNYGAEVPFLRPKNISTSTSPDYQWVNFTIKQLEKKGLVRIYTNKSLFMGIGELDSSNRLSPSRLTTINYTYLLR